MVWDHTAPSLSHLSPEQVTLTVIVHYSSLNIPDILLLYPSLPPNDPEENGLTIYTILYNCIITGADQWSAILYYLLCLLDPVLVRVSWRREKAGVRLYSGETL